MDCKNVRDLLSAHIDKELEAEEREQVEAHLKECSGCKENLARMKSAIKMIQSLGELEVPAEVSRSLGEIALAEKDGRVRGRRLFLPRLQYLVAAGVVAAIALASILSQININTPENGTTGQHTLPGKTPALSEEYGSNKAQKAEAPTDAGVEGRTNASRDTAQTSTKKIGPWPEVVVLQKNYDSKAADELLINIKKKTDGLFTVGDVKELHNQAMDLLVNRISDKAGINGELMRSPISAILNQTKRPALPIYMEKANFNKQDCWLLVIRWGFGSTNNSLNRASLYITDLSGWNMLYYTSS
ncbi:MAG: zf-HC2 domain-containing protein [Firmicutes bacterium]|nr:zf-HC2 domain-containing protein [Bacillota bacterium]